MLAWYTRFKQLKGRVCQLLDKYVLKLVCARHCFKDCKYISELFSEKNLYPYGTYFHHHLQHLAQCLEHVACQ